MKMYLFAIPKRYETMGKEDTACSYLIVLVGVLFYYLQKVSITNGKNAKC